MQQQAASPPQPFRHFIMSLVKACKSTALPSLQVGALLLTGICWGFPAMQCPPFVFAIQFVSWHTAHRHIDSLGLHSQNSGKEAKCFIAYVLVITFVCTFKAS